MREAVASPSAMREAVASPSAMREAVASPSAMREAVASPSAMREAVASPSAMREAVASPSAMPPKTQDAFPSYISYTPRGIRIPVLSMKKRCPRPLDDGGFCLKLNTLYIGVFYLSTHIFTFCAYVYKSQI